MTLLLREIDDGSRPDHAYLDAADRVFFLREYTSRRDYRAGETNNLISNLKKPMNLAGTPQWKYKARAIEQCARELREAVPTRDGLTWVPVPPSKMRSDPLFDDRLSQILHRAFPQGDIRELVAQSTSMSASHGREDSTTRPRG